MTHANRTCDRCGLKHAARSNYFVMRSGNALCVTCWHEWSIFVWLVEWVMLPWARLGLPPVRGRY